MFTTTMFQIEALLEDTLWLLTLQATIIHIARQVWLNWKKPFRKATKKKSTGGCARFYIRANDSHKESHIGTRRRRQIIVLLLATTKTIALPQSAPQVDCCFLATSATAPNTRYDSDSFQIAIDNCAMSCFTNDLQDFIDTPRDTHTKILGIGQATSTFIGTVKWLIVDDNGR